MGPRNTKSNLLLHPDSDRELDGRKKVDAVGIEPTTFHMCDQKMRSENHTPWIDVRTAWYKIMRLNLLDQAPDIRDGKVAKLIVNKRKFIFTVRCAVRSFDPAQCGVTAYVAANASNAFP